MRNFKFILISIFLLVASLASRSQTASVLDSMESQYQSCLDKGDNMQSCAKNYYVQMDKMMNKVYAKLRSRMDSTQKLKLQAEQMTWLAKRNAYFKQTLKEYNSKVAANNPDDSALSPKDYSMIMYNDNAAFVKERVLALLKKLNK